MTGNTAGGPMMMLAFDHRSVLQAIYQTWRPGGLPEATVTELKEIVVDALLDARGRIAALGGRAALLMDELTGANAGMRARRAGVVTAAPIEASGAAVFTLEYGSAFLEHMVSYPADYAKALVFLNSAEPDGAYDRQIAAVSAVFRPLRDAGFQMLLEVVVPPTADQLSAVGCDGRVFDAEIRPGLVCQAIDDCYAAGIAPHVWKLEGLETARSYRMVGKVVRKHSPAAQCLVLGRGVSGERVSNWLQLAAAQAEFHGFAIGRSIWQEALGSWIRGEITRATAVSRVSERYCEFAAVYSKALPAQRRQGNPCTP